jgi:hypothetical protein
LVVAHAIIAWLSFISGYLIANSVGRGLSVNIFLVGVCSDKRPADRILERCGQVVERASLLSGLLRFELEWRIILVAKSAAVGLVARLLIEPRPWCQDEFPVKGS